MAQFSTIAFYVFSFLSVYVQVFFIYTFFENRKKILKKDDEKAIELTSEPSITVIVPCWNEEKAIVKTIESLLNLDYPKDKLKIFIIDDGSSDKTWEIIQIFKDIPNIRLFHKKNGGKYTALNLGLENLSTEFFSCLDADSTVEPKALKKMLPYFHNQEVMAVIPSALVTKPETMVQRAQKAEYNMAVFFKKVFSLIGGLHVTPGTLPIYRKKVVDLVGGFRHGHNGEDMEMAFRMQKNHLKIVQCHEAVVYTIPPASIKVLYKQRVRWISAYLGNILDYKNMIFNKEYGNFAWFSLPSGIISILAVVFIFFQSIYSLVEFIAGKIIKIKTVGLASAGSNMDWFTLNFNGVLFTMIISYILVTASLFIGNRLAEGKAKFSSDILYFIGIYSFVAPFWLMKAVYNTVFSKGTSWR